MEKQDFKTALDFLKSISEKRKFVQAVDLIINLKNLDLKQPDQQIDLFVQIPHASKKNRICCFCGPELLPNAKQNCDLAIATDEFSRYQGDKKAIKKLASDYDYFFAQANIMPEVAKVFGRVLGPRGKMPNPKAGAVVAPNANLKPLADKFAKTVRLSAKTQLCIKALLGKESQPENEILDNAFMLFESLRKALPQEMNNVKNVLLKFTMSKPVPVGIAPDEIKKAWEEQAKAAEEGKKRMLEHAANRPKRAKKVKVEEPKFDLPQDGAPKKPIQRAVWETDLDKPRAPRKPRPYGEERSSRGRRDKSDRR